MKKEGRKRLENARFALQTVENRHGVRSYTERTFSASPIKAGLYHLEGNLSGLVFALTRAAGEKSWIAVAGIKNFGWEAAGNAGVPLERLVVVECSQEHAAVALATLLEGFDVLVVGDLSLAPVQQRTLVARARTAGRVIITVRPWLVPSMPLTDLSPSLSERTFSARNVV